MKLTQEEISLRNQSTPIKDVMRFSLVYHGPLSSGGNRKTGKQNEIQKIREHFSEQLEFLWRTNAALSELKKQAWAVSTNGLQFIPFLTQAIDYPKLAEEYPEDFTPLWGDIGVSDVNYRPLVRQTLNLACALDVQFLRQEDPGALISQAGDIDGRLKILLDALRMPTVAEQERAVPTEKQVFCLMESDTLVSALNIETERLLFPKTEYPNEVHLIVGVELRLLRITPENTCLL
ncbi:MAG: hypothetical protein NXH78_05240 [Hyphomonadaceae bacterium]|nr:hypothetical protein [Hyphomonadaceae bacterium]